METLQIIGSVACLILGVVFSATLLVIAINATFLFVGICEQLSKRLLKVINKRFED
ncbi:MAG: hypothetical protein IJK81_13625 [Selenomonadaceae bacterium]|nr:hypothetical protein [Selenomonadaceae bacterium]